MDFDHYTLKMKDLQNLILEMIENDEKTEENYENIMKIIENSEIKKDANEFRSFLHLINNISCHHNRNNNFFEKINKIILQFDANFKNLPNKEILMIFKNNANILLLLIQNDILSISDVKDYTKGNNLKCNINNIISNQPQNSQIIDEDLKYLKLIQDDNINDFITYVTKYDLHLETNVKNLNNETNIFLYDKSPSLIEYAAFFGSIQIFTYLYKNQVDLTPSLWIYAIHGFNPEIIHILEEEKIEPEDNTYKQCLKEAIKCHHNDIANYIKINYCQNQPNINDFICQKSIRYHNYMLFPQNLFTWRWNIYFNCLFLVQEW